MKSANDCAFKEWAVSCEALLDGRQTILIRKGGIREEGGAFRMQETEFFLFPTYEHQQSALLQPDWKARLHSLSTQPRNSKTVVLSAYGIIDTIAVAREESQVNALSHEHIWNPQFVKMRFDYNPYDPLYLVLLRIYRLQQPIIIPARPEYEGCKSWITLTEPHSTSHAVPVLSDEEFTERRTATLKQLLQSD